MRVSQATQGVGSKAIVGRRIPKGRTLQRRCRGAVRATCKVPAGTSVIRGKCFVAKDVSGVFVVQGKNCDQIDCPI